MPGRNAAYAAAVRTAAYICAFAGLSLASGASAQVVEASTITNSYSYQVGSQQGSDPNAPGNVGLFITDTSGGFEHEMGLALTGTLNNGSFYFLHNGHCVGNCRVSIATDITFTLTNMGPDPVDLRFDSQITPGHLARSNFFGRSPAAGSFLFQVTQDQNTLASALYSADGHADLTPILVETSDNRGFNAMTRNDNAPLWNVLDWSATNLNLNLATLGAGQTTTLRYSSQLDIATFTSDCTDVNLCPGFQVAFGDPRNVGVPTLQSSGARFAALESSVNPAVGALYDPYLVTYAFVPANSPLPSNPSAIGPLNYTIPYTSLGAIPEPATWAMMLMGFAAVGAAARRRRMPAIAPA